MIRTVLILTLLMLSFNSQGQILKTSIFSSLKNPSSTIDLKTASLNKSTFIAHDCKACHQLLRALQKECTSLDVTTFAVGNKNNLKSKLKMLRKLNSKVFIGSSTQAYSEIGVDIMPYYISSTGEKHESDVQTAMMNDGVCQKKDHN